MTPRNAPVERARFASDRGRSSRQPQKEREDPVCHENAGRGRGQGQARALNQKQPEDLPPSAPQGEADAQLAAFSQDAYQHEVGRIQARDGVEERDSAQQHPVDLRMEDLLDLVETEQLRLQIPTSLRDQAAGNLGHRRSEGRLGLLRGDPRFQPANDEQYWKPRFGRIDCEDQRTEDIAIGVYRHLRSCRQHAHDFADLPAHLDLPAEHVRPAGEMHPPETVADHRNIVIPGPEFLRQEAAAENRRKTERRETVGGHALDRREHGLVSQENVHRVILRRGESGKCVGPAAPGLEEEAEEEWIRGRLLAFPSEDAKPVLLRVGIHLEQHPVSHAEDRGCGADPQGERDHDDQRETIGAAERAHGIA